MDWLFEKKCVDCVEKCCENEDFKEIVGCLSIYYFDENKGVVTVLHKVVFYDENFGMVSVPKNYNPLTFRKRGEV